MTSSPSVVPAAAPAAIPADPGLLPWAVAILGPAIATSARLMMSGVWDEGQQVYIFYFPALVACAMLGSARHGAACVALSALMAHYALIPPVMTFGPPRPGDLVGLVVFVGVGLGVALLGARLREQRTLAAIRAAEARAAEGSRRGAEAELRRRLAQIETILDAVPAIVWIAHDPEGRFITGNRAADELLGVPRGGNASAAEPAVGGAFRVRIDGRDTPPADLPVQRACRGEKIDGIHEEIVFADGRVRHIVGNAVPLLTPDGRHHGAVAAFMDTTAERAAAAAIRQSEARFRALADSMPIIVWTARPDGETDYFNSRWCEYTGLDGEPMGRAAWRAILHPDDLPGASARWGRSLATGEPFEAEHRLRHGPTGEYRWHLTRAAPVREGRISDAPIERWYGSSVEVHDQLLTRERLAGTVHALERSNAALEEFVHIASHDLKEPIRGIRNYAAFVLEDFAPLLDDEGRRKLQTIDRLGRRLDAMITSLLQFSRVSRADLHPEPVDLNELVAGVVHLVSPLLAKTQAEVRGIGDLPIVRCDRSMVVEVYAHLLTNGLTYNTRAAKRVEVGCRDAAAGVAAIFWVRDNGIGIPERHHATVFQIFERLHGRDEFVDPEAKGTAGIGAGLAIVRRIIERHGGRIWLESAPDEGTTVFFTLTGDSHGALDPADRHR